MQAQLAQTPSVRLFDAAFRADPHPTFAWLRDHAPVYRTRLPTKQFATIITRYDDVLWALHDPQLAKDPRNAGKTTSVMPWVPAFVRPLSTSMIDRDEPDHRRLRTLVQQAFTPRRIEQLRPRIQTLCNDLIDRTQRTGQIELVRQFALPVPITVITDLLGVPQADRARFQRLASGIASVTSTLELLGVLPRLWLFMRYLRGLIALRRREPQDDLLSALVQAEAEGDKLSEDELLAMVFLLLIAGHETTVNLIASGTLALLQHPDQTERLRRDPATLRPAVEELLRWTSPVNFATERYASRDMTIGDVSIARGEMVLAALGSANHDERQFANPRTLDLARSPNKHLALGQGMHFCLGAPLARLEGEIAFGTLLERLPQLRLARPAAPLRWRKGIFIRGVEHLPLAF